MKPDGGLAGDMDDDDVDPSDLFCALGLLVVESRQPHLSLKGWVQGHHCPLAVTDTPRHHCDRNSRQCRNFEVVYREIQLLWKNRIPLCIEVVLLPDCPHGEQTAQAPPTSPALSTPWARSLLLEQWTIQAMPKRCVENTGKPRALFQAVKSHLHFSQLSAWLNIMQGTAPRHVAYRVSPPGEFCTSSFSQPPEGHTFPLCGVGRSTAIKVCCRAMPRLQGIPRVPCPAPHEHMLPGAGFRTHGGGAMPPHHLMLPSDVVTMQPIGARPRNHNSNKPHTKQSLNVHSVQQTHNQHAKSPGKSPPSSAMWDQHKETMQGSISHKNAKSCSSTVSDHLTQMLSPQEAGSSCQRQLEFGAIPKKRLPHKSPPDYFDHHAMSAPELELLAGDSSTEVPDKSKTSRSASPKVIITKKSSSQGYVEPGPTSWLMTSSAKSVISQDTDSDNSSPDIDKILHKTLGNQIDPMTPGEIQAYLADLCLSQGARHNARTDVTHATSTANKISKSPSTHIYSTSPVFQKHFLDVLKQLSQDSVSVSDDDSLELSPDNRSHPSQCKNVSSNGQYKPEGDTNQRNGVTSQSNIKNHTVTSQANTASNCVKFEVGGELPQDEVFSLNGYHPQSKSPLIVSDRTASSPTAERHSTSTCITSDKDLSHPFISKSISAPGDYPLSSAATLESSGVKRANSLLKSVIRKELVYQLHDEDRVVDDPKPIPSSADRAKFRQALQDSAGMLFHPCTGLPLQSSPAPIKKREMLSFGYDCSINSVRAIKNSISCVNLDHHQLVSTGEDDCEENGNKQRQKLYSTSAPASTNCLLGNFEESMLNGRLEPVGVVDGFTAEICASGAFCPKHLTLPVTAFFFSLSEDNAPSPYLGHVNLETLGKRGYHLPKKGTVQVTLFNPNKTVLKMFVVVYDLSGMPPSCQTFLRQRILYMPVMDSPSDQPEAPVYLRYLIHLRFASSKSGKIYLHTDLRMIFARDKMEYDSRVAHYELRSFTEGPVNPKFSPKR